MKKQEKQIRQGVLSEFPLAFKKKSDQSTHFSAVETVEIMVNEGMELVCTTVANKVPIGMAEDCKALINRLLAQGNIK